MMTEDRREEPPRGTQELPKYTKGAERVLRAASELFYREGIHTVGVDAIAAAAGVTKKTLYDQFGSKEALAVAYLRRRDARWREYLEHELAQVPEGGTERILAIFDISGRWATDNCDKGCCAINARAETADPESPIAAEAIRQKKWLRDLLEQLCRQASVADPAQGADSLMLLYEGGLVTMGMGTFPKPFAVGRVAAARMLAISSPQAP
jgi:AcrR family transcriptional regulator